MQYKHPNFGDSKVFHVTIDWDGRTVIEETAHGVAKGSLVLRASERKSFEDKLVKNGWHAVEG